MKTNAIYTIIPVMQLEFNTHFNCTEQYLGKDFFERDEFVIRANFFDIVEVSRVNLSGPVENP